MPCPKNYMRNIELKVADNKPANVIKFIEAEDNKRVCSRPLHGKGHEKKTTGEMLDKYNKARLLAFIAKVVMFRAEIKEAFDYVSDYLYYEYEDIITGCPNLHVFKSIKTKAKELEQSLAGLISEIPKKMQVIWNISIAEHEYNDLEKKLFFTKELKQNLLFVEILQIYLSLEYCSFQNLLTYRNKAAEILGMCGEPSFNHCITWLPNLKMR